MNEVFFGSYSLQIRGYDHAMQAGRRAGVRRSLVLKLSGQFLVFIALRVGKGPSAH